MDRLILPKWFKNRLQTVRVYNEYEPTWLTVSECEKNDKWTPCDLIYREHLNNGGGSAKGFLGLTPAECRKAATFISEHKQELVDMDLLSRKGWNNCGITLWNI